MNIPQDLIQKGKLLSLDDENEEFIEAYKRVISSDDVKHAEDEATIGHDNFIGMELGIRRGDESQMDKGIVKRRALDDNGVPLGNYHANLIVNSAQYEVDFGGDDVEIPMMLRSFQQISL